MSNNIQTLNAVLEKYKISQPLPLHVRRQQLINKRKSLIELLKKTKRYNPLLGLVIYVYFLFKSYGLTISMLQSALVVSTVSLVTVATLSSGVYLIVKNVIKVDFDLLDSRDTLLPLQFNDEVKVDPQEIKKESQAILPFPPKENLRPALREAKNKIRIMDFDDNKAGTKAKQMVAKVLREELVLFRGKNNILTSGQNQPANIILYGAVERIGKIYSLTIRATDKESGKIVFISSKQAKSLEELKNVTRLLAEDLVDKIK